MQQGNYSGALCAGALRACVPVKIGIVEHAHPERAPSGRMLIDGVDEVHQEEARVHGVMDRNERRSKERACGENDEVQRVKRRCTCSRRGCERVMDAVDSLVQERHVQQPVDPEAPITSHHTA